MLADHIESGLTRFLQAAGEQVVELDRPRRARPRDGAKNTSIDAVRAAREVLGRHKLAIPRARGDRAGLAAVLAARRSAVQAATDAQRQLLGLAMSAPETLAGKFRGLSSSQVVARATRLQIDPALGNETAYTGVVLRSLARRVLMLEREADEHRRSIAAIVSSLCPEILEITAVGPIVAATVSAREIKRCLKRSWLESSIAFSKGPRSRLTRHKCMPSGPRRSLLACACVL
jgi:hypothetical protein